MASVGNAYLFSQPRSSRSMPRPSIGYWGACRCRSVKDGVIIISP